MLKYCFQKRELSKIDDSIPVFNLDGFKGYCRVTSVYDGDTFKGCIIKHGRVLKFVFRTLHYDSPELKPRLNIPHRQQHIQAAVHAREHFKDLIGFNHETQHTVWNPFLCRTKVKGFVYIECGKNDKYGRTLVDVYKKKGDTVSVNKKMIDSGLVNIYDGGTKKDFTYK